MKGDTRDLDDEGSEPCHPTGRHRRPARAPVSWTFLLAVVLGACGGEASTDSTGASSVRVFAASSLTEAMTELGARYESSHPGTRVAFTFGGSQILRLQISQGATVDVFASANEAHLTSLASEGMIDHQQILAENALALIVPIGEAGPVRSFEDLTKARRIVIGSRAVPIGAYTQALLERAGAHYGAEFRHEVLERVVSEEGNVRLVRAKVELGEADAAFVYATDALASDRSVRIPIPQDVNVRARYVLGAVADPPNRVGRDAFLRWLGTSQAHDILRSHGFSVPSP